jgi:glutathione S-transferase
MVLEEKGLSFKRIEEDLSNLSPELLALHPEGRVPLLIDQTGDRKLVLYQSNVITEYLDEAFPEVPLMPAGADERAQVRLWTYWCDQIFKPDLDLYKYERASLSAPDAEALVKRIHEQLEHWDTALKKNGFLVGGKMTLADIHLFPFARQFLATKPALPGVEKYASLAKWLQEMTSRPAFERCMAK